MTTCRRFKRRIVKRKKDPKRVGSGLLTRKKKTKQPPTFTKDTYMFKHPRISCGSLSDNTYKEIGVIQMTESYGKNFFREIGTVYANLIGRKGFDNTCYNRAKMEALTKLAKRIQDNQRVCNLRMDVENNNCTVFVHLFGSLYEK